MHPAVTVTTAIIATTVVSTSYSILVSSKQSPYVVPHDVRNSRVEVQTRLSMPIPQKRKLRQRCLTR